MIIKFGNIIFVSIDNEESECEDCHKIDDCRPYGPNGTSICYECAMKDPEGTQKRFNESLDGKPN